MFIANHLRKARYQRHLQFVDCPLSIDPIVLKGMTTTILSSSASQAKPAPFLNAPATPSWWFEVFCLHRKFLLFNLIKRNLKLKYRQSYLGIFWTVLAPALNAGVYFVVFSFVMRVQLPHYLVFMFSGLLAWVFFSISLAHGMESIVNNYSLISVDSHNNTLKLCLFKCHGILRSS